LIKAIPPLKARYLNYEDFAKATVDDIFPASDRTGAIERSVQTFASALLRNDGNGSFTLVPLPDEAQLAPVHGILPRDVDGDGALDLLVAGNFDGFKPEIGRAAESRGLVLRGDGKGGFAPLTGAAIGFVVPGQSRDIQRVRTRSGELIVVAQQRPTTRLSPGVAVGGRGHRLEELTMHQSISKRISAGATVAVLVLSAFGGVACSGKASAVDRVGHGAAGNAGGPAERRHHLRHLLPPQASRVYAYASVAAYEALAGGHHLSHAGGR
jgi:hypothetical protein